jgi:hypothetical protein
MGDLYVTIRVPGWALVAAASLAVAAPVALFASDVTIPNSFTNGTVADADAVNANFAAVEAAVDDNDARLSSVESASGTQASELTTLGGRVDSLELGAGDVVFANSYTEAGTVVSAAPRLQYLDSNVTVTVPEDGTYLVLFSARMYALDCLGADSWWKARVHNETAGTELVESFGINCNDLAVNADTTVSGHNIVSLSAGQVLRLQYYVNGGGSTNVVLADGNGGHSITLLRVGD